MRTRAIALVTAVCTAAAVLAAPALADRGWEKKAGHRAQTVRWDCDDRHEWEGYGRRDYQYRPPEVYYRPPAPVRWDREFLGALLGGATGGLLGSRIGKGGGRAAAVVGGTFVGAMVGSSIGRTMDDVDRLRVAQVLDSGRCREPVAWHNRDTRSRYEVTPLADYQETNGRYCREFQTAATIAGDRQQLYGTACRQPDGTWELVR